MLTLLIFAPCEKVILGKDDDTASIISVLETVKITAPADLPLDTLLPLRWMVMSLWKRPEDIDAPVGFEQQVQVLWKDGSQAANGLIPFSVTKENLMYRTLVSFPVFPIGQEGQVLIKARLRQTNPETEWVDVADFPLTVIHEPQQETITQDNAPKEPEEVTEEP